MKNCLLLVLVIVILVLFSNSEGVSEGVSKGVPENFKNSEGGSGNSEGIFNIFSPRDMFGVSQCCDECDKQYGYGSGYPASKWCEDCGAPGRGPCWDGAWTGVIGD